MNRCKITLLLLVLMNSIVLTGCGVGFNLSAYFYTTHDSFDFGKTIISASKFVDINLENHGPVSLMVKYIAIEDETGAKSAEFTIDTLFDNDGDIIHEPYTNQLMRGKTKLTVRVRFSSDIVGDKNAILTILHDAEIKKSPYKIQLAGCVKSMITPSTLDFSSIVSNVKHTKELRIDNIHTENITITKIEISSGGAYFTIVDAKKNGVIHISAGNFAAVIQPDEFIIVSVETNSPGVASKNGSVAIHHDIGGIHSPVYGNLKVRTVENKPPEIRAISTNNPTIKVDGIDYLYLSVRVFDPNGLSDINSVFADMTPTGDTIRLMYDNGLNGDAIKDDGVYTLRFNSVIRDKLIGRFDINVTALDFNNEAAADSVEVFFYTDNKLEVGVQPGAYAFYNISSAIQSANDGDYILVHNGTYEGYGNTDFNFLGKEILFRSENGAENTTINCRNWGTGVTFGSSAKNTTIMQGFKIINANNNLGGGIFVSSNASPQILDCVIENCRAVNGAGIYCDKNSKPIIERLEIKTCTSTSTGGGIFVCEFSEPIISDCTIINNTAKQSGGIHCEKGSPSIINSKIIDNKSNEEAGGIYVDSSPFFTIQDSIIAGNTSVQEGGGIYAIDSDLNIERCSFENNHANTDGGGIEIKDSEGLLRKCKFVNNTSDNSGGGLMINESKLSFRNCLVIENSAQLNGGGFAIIGISTIDMINNTISKNSSRNGGGIYYACPLRRMYIYNSIIWANIATANGKEIFNQAGNINLNNVDYSDTSGSVYGNVYTNGGCLNLTPQFIDTSTNTLSGTITFNLNSNVVNGNSSQFHSEILPGDLIYLDIDGATFAMTVAEVSSNSQLILMGKYRGNGGSDSAIVKHCDYHLNNGSPCINRGENSYLPSNLTTDLDNNPRIKGTNVDLGPYEKQ
ncbi:MAG: right-handed parallel beta-helix repeat-containing protein [Planctomycetes bacterium]|nr:right-handed parallel beta-helix repeat-containing protein [Planctomycetota bacterium]